MSPRATCCAPCATRSDASRTVTGIVRAVGALTYLGRGVEHVDAAPSSLGRPAMFVGVPVRRNHGAHGGHTIGVVLSARRVDGAIECSMRIEDDDALAEIRAGDAAQFSTAYDCDVDAAGVQRITRVTEVALVAVGRCGETCSVTRVDALDLAPSELARASIQARAKAAIDAHNAPRPGLVLAWDRDSARMVPGDGSSAPADQRSPAEAARQRMIARGR